MNRSRLLFQFALPAFALLFILADCGQPHPDPRSGQAIAVRGTGKILTLNQKMGSGTITTSDGPRNFWWQVESVVPSNDKEAPEPNIIHYTFPAKEGDTIEYKGVQTYGDIFITALEVRKP